MEWLTLIILLGKNVSLLLAADGGGPQEINSVHCKSSEVTQFSAIQVLLKNIDPVLQAGKPKISSIDKINIQAEYEAMAKTIAISSRGVVDTKVSKRLGEAFSPDRELFHQELLAQILGKPTDYKPKNPENPRLVIMAGSPGAGKSSVINMLGKNSLLNREDFMLLDIDDIRNKIKEYDEYREVLKGEDSDTRSLAAVRTQKEAIYIHERALSLGLAAGKQIIKDGTMRDATGYLSLIERVRKLPTKSPYEIVLVHVDVCEAVAKARQQERDEREDRAVNSKYFQTCTPEKIGASVSQVRPQADLFIQVDNNGENPKVHAFEQLRSPCSPALKRSWLRRTCKTGEQVFRFERIDETY